MSRISPQNNLKFKFVLFASPKKPGHFTNDPCIITSRKVKVFFPTEKKMVIPSDWIGGHARLPVQTSGVLGEGLVGGFNPTHLQKYVSQKWVRIFPQCSGWRFQEYLKPRT